MLMHVREALMGTGLDESLAVLTVSLVGGVLLLLACAAAYVALSRLFLLVLRRIGSRRETAWVVAVFKTRLVPRVALLAPAVVLQYALPRLLGPYPVALDLATAAMNIYLTLVVLFIISSALNATVRVYQRFAAAGQLPIKGIVQGIKIVVFLVGLVVILSQLFGNTPKFYLTGLGAGTAVLMLIFNGSSGKIRSKRHLGHSGSCRHVGAGAAHHGPVHAATKSAGAQLGESPVPGGYRSPSLSSSSAI